MRKIILGLALFMGLVFGEALALTQEQLKSAEDLCKAGSNEACLVLGIAYFGDADDDANKDIKKAKFYLDTACENGLNMACGVLGELYLES